MRKTSHRGSPRRRRWLLALTVSVAAIAAPITAPSPASAAPAPLITEDGVGIRVDETALTGPALDAIENALQPFVDNMIYQGGIDGAPISSYMWMDVDSNVELSLDFLAPSGGRPYGGLSVFASIQDIELEYRADPWWPFSDCSIYVRPDDASITATASVDPTELPAAPLDLDPIQATWDDDPTVDYTGVCWYYLIDDLFSGWWDDLVGNDPESTASKIEAQLNGEAQELIDGLWEDHVVPVVDSLQEFGLDWGQIRTDTNGLIVTADLDATGGLQLPGLPITLPVNGAEDSGATSNVNTLLQTRPVGGGDIIVSVHPNVANQFLYATNLLTGGTLGFPGVPLANVPALETALLPAGARASYPDNSWFVHFQALTAPVVTPTGPGGAPLLSFNSAIVEFTNSGFSATPVSTFTGSLTGVKLKTGFRAGTQDWGPYLDASSATLNVTRTQADANAAMHPAPSSSTILPYAKLAFNVFADIFIEGMLTLGPISIGDIDVTLCTACGRYSGDQRYTETLTVS